MSIPSLYEWIGGSEALNALIEESYRRVRDDDLIGPVFARMGADHPAHVAAFVGEVFGGPKIYSTKHGGHPEMIRHHMGRHPEAQRRRWIALLMDSCEYLDLPHDPEFASALAGYFEWGFPSCRSEFTTRGQGVRPFADAQMGMGRGRRPLSSDELKHDHRISALHNSRRAPR